MISREDHCPEGVIGDIQKEQTMSIWINNLGDIAQTLAKDLQQCLAHLCHLSITHRDMQG